MSDGEVKPRSYDNSGRLDQARASRRRVLEAAHDLLVVEGFGGMRLAEVARRAGVSVETVYKQFGNKGGLLKAVYDVRLAGDDQPIPIGERPAYTAIWSQPDPREKIRAYTALARELAERSGQLVAIVFASRGANPDIEQFAQTIEQERLHGATAFVTHLAEAQALRPGLDSDQARDLLWMLISPEVHTLLIDRRGWSYAAFQAWLDHAVADALLGRP